jgi:uncharacterized protein (DUF885 family)
MLGDRRFDDRMPDVTPAGRARQNERLTALRARTQAIAEQGLSDADRITRRALLEEIENDLTLLACRLDDFSVDPRSGPQVDLLTLARMLTVTSPEEGTALVLRWQKIGAHIDDRIQNLRASRAEGRVPVKNGALRVIAQLDDLLKTPDTAWILMAPLEARHPTWPEASERSFREGVERAMSDQIRPAFQRYRDALAKEILPAARDGKDVGLSSVPGGRDAYTRLIKYYTSLALSPDEIHQFGLEEIARVRSEMKALGKKALGTDDLAEIQKRLRSDKTLFFKTRDEVEAKAAEALARAEAAFPRWFERAPKTPCSVKRIEAYEEKDSTIAYYRPPAADGSRQGFYFINTYAPETRPRFDAEVLAFHEAVPGHHTQIAIAQELTGVPEFRKHTGSTAYIEGWALYTERLADEMGLYSSDLDRIGMLSFDAWRASRLVVDTGIHTMGWTREEAEAYMLENTVLAENNIETEVDRYISWPGQALAYKIGQREILRLRAEAERALGPAFDIKGFHAAVLGSGAVSLAILRDVASRWTAARASGK